MFLILRKKSLLVWLLFGAFLLAGCQNLADVSADRYAGELPPQSEQDR